MQFQSKSQYGGFFFFFGETHQTDPKIHVEDIMGKKEMFLKKNGSGVLPGLPRCFACRRIVLRLSDEVRDMRAL